MPGRSTVGQRRGDGGITLLELMVAMGIFSILIALVSTIVIGTMRSYSDQRGTVDNTRTASTSMNEITRIIRAGTEIPVYGVALNDPMFTYAGAEQITMYSFIDPATSSDPPPLKVQFARDANNELVETRWGAYHVHTTYWAFNATSTYGRTIARSLLPSDAAKPTFRYYDKTGAELVPPSGGSLTTATIRKIASVKVTLRVQTSGSARIAPVELQNQVGLPNLGVARVEVH